MKPQKMIVQLTSFIAMFALVFSGFFPLISVNSINAQTGVAPVVSNVVEVSIPDTTPAPAAKTEVSADASLAVSVGSNSNSSGSSSNSGSSSSDDSSSGGSSGAVKTKTISSQLLKDVKNLDQISPKLIKIVKGSNATSVKEDSAPSTTKDSLTCPEADFNEDSTIDTRDILAFLNAWNDEDVSTDMNFDGEFTQADLDIFLAIWQDCYFGLSSMCYAPDNLGIINRTEISSPELQEIFKIYADGDEEKIIDTYEDQVNYQIWRMNVSGSLSGLNLSCEIDADYDQNGIIDTRDMLAYLNDWADKDIGADMNNDSVVDTFDFHIFFSLWKICRAGDNIELSNSTMDVELIDSRTDRPIVFGYYLNGDLDSFTPVFKVGDHNNYPDVPELSNSDVISFTPEYFGGGEFTQEVGFAVDVQGIFSTTAGVFVSEKFATERSLNSDSSIQALVYDFDQNEFVIAFDDQALLDGSDSDFNDLVVKITAKACEDGELETPTLETPDNQSFVKGDSLTSAWSKVSGAINYIYQRFSDEAGSDLILQGDAPENEINHEGLEEQEFWWRVKANGSGGQSDWSGLWKVTVDNTAPSTVLSIPNGQSFTGNIPFTGTTVDNWNVDTVAIYQSDFVSGGCSAFTQISTVDIAGNEANAVWNYDWNPGVNGSFCVRADGVDLAGNIEAGAPVQNVAFTTSEGDGGDNGGGSGGNSGGGSSGGGGYYDDGSSDGRVLGAFSGDERDQLLNLLRLRLLALQGQLNNLDQPTTEEGEVLGTATAEAQEIPDEIEVMEDESDEVVVESEEEKGISKIILWILFIIILIIILFLIFKRRKEENQPISN